jgi:hypothetical protein
LAGDGGTAEEGIDVMPTKAVTERPIDLWNVHAVEVLGAPAGWQWYNASCRKDDAPAGFTRLIGAVPVGFKRNGRPKWGKASEATKRTLFRDDLKYLAWVKEWEARMGICSRCMNERRTVKSVSIDPATKKVTRAYELCKRCQGKEST